jgi:CHASE1-domain containing sensor protein
VNYRLFIMTAGARLRRIKPLGPVFCTALLGLIISVFAWFSVSRMDERLAVQEFNENADHNKRTLESGLDRYFYNLVALDALFDSTPNEVTRQEFVTFSKTLLKGQTAILGVTWIPRVTREGRAAHEMAARRDGITDYHIRNSAADAMRTALSHQVRCRFEAALVIAEVFSLSYRSIGTASRPTPWRIAATTSKDLFLASFRLG